MLTWLTRKRSVRWRRVVVLAALLLVIPTLAGASGKRVERWIGKIEWDTLWTNQVYGYCGHCFGDFHESHTDIWDLSVFEDGTVSGSVNSTWTDYSWQQTQFPPDICHSWFSYQSENWEVRNCRQVYSLGKSDARNDVTGTVSNSNGGTTIELEGSIGSEAEYTIYQDGDLWYDPPAWDDPWRYIGPYHSERTHKITPYLDWRDFSRVPSDGLRPPLALLDGVEYYFHQGHNGSSSRTVAYQGYLVGFTDAPLLDLDKELLERSTFLAGVPVTDQFTAKLTWNSPDKGTVKWKLGDAAVEQVGPTDAAEVPKVVQAEAQQLGKTPLVVQASTPLGGQSAPQNTQVVVAQQPNFTADQVVPSGNKMGGTVQYKREITWPKPGLKGVVDVPSFMPFFGGKPLGLVETQFTGTAEVLGTGEGSLALRAKTGLAAIGSVVQGFVEGKAKGILNGEGWSLTGGTAKFGIEGKVEKEEALLKVIPALAGAVTALEQLSPAAANFLKNRAKAKLELKPSWDFGVEFEAPPGGEIHFKDATTTQGLKWKVGAELNLWDKIATAFFGLGGNLSATLHVPPPVFKEAVISLGAFATIQYWNFVMGPWETNYVVTIPGGAAAASPGPADRVASSGPAGWQLRDRSYQTRPGYARWTADAQRPVAQGAAAAPDDVQLVENVGPLAWPALAQRAAGGGESLILAWAHDRPDLPVLQSGEIAWSENAGTGWSAPAYLTHDNYDDAYPEVAYLPDGRALMVWQRLDTPTPGDVIADPALYVSHWQVAAAVAGSGDAPQQLSAGGSVNYGYHLGATSTGALVVWVNNPGNQLIGDAAKPDQVLSAAFDAATSTWSAAQPILTDLVDMTGLDLATNGSRAALVYSLDMDGDLATEGDSEIYYVLWQDGSWGAPVRLTNNGVPDLAPRVALSDNSEPLVVWQHDGALQFLALDWTGTPEALSLPGAAEHLDYRLVRGSDGTIVLTWQAPGADSTPIGYAVFDAANRRWSTERTYTLPEFTGTVTPTIGMATGIAPALLPASAQNPARLLLGYQLAHLELITRTVDGVSIPNMPNVTQHDLRVATLPLGIDLRVAPADLWADDAATLHAVIHNDGTLAAAAVPVVLRGWLPAANATEALTVTLPLIVAGDAVTATFDLPAQMRGLADYAVVVDPAGTLPEADRTNNQARLGAPLGLVMLPSLVAPDAIVLSAVITQGGAIYIPGPISATLTLEDVAGTPVGGARVSFPLTPTSAITTSAMISVGLLGPGYHLIFWSLDASSLPANADRDAAVAATTVLVAPDLTADPLRIGFGSAPGDTALFVMDVRNAGSLSSHGGAVEAWDGRPDKPTSHRLLRLPLPDLLPGPSTPLTGTLELTGLPAATTGLQGLWVWLDPDNVIEEFNENNNIVAVGDAIGDDSPAAALPIYLPLLWNQ